MKSFLISTFIIILLFACQKDLPLPPPNPTEPQYNTITPSVYIAGHSYDSSTGFKSYPVYWKNGRQVNLPLPVASSGTGIAVSDTNVYVSNSGTSLGSNVTYWKNGIGINLTDPTIITPIATNIVLSGNDVYTVGGAYTSNYERFAAIYWKNQDKGIKLQTFSGHGNAYAIAVAGNDVYVAGSASDPATAPGYNSACYWKNEMPVFLYSSSSYVNGVAHSIFLSDTNIYVVGRIYSPLLAPALEIAVYWKNGKATELTDSLSASVANSVFVNGNDVYIAGGIAGSDRFWRAACWKNGVVTILDSMSSVAKAITVFENDVYIAGNRGRDTALYWKNNKPVILGRGRANAIVVKK
jgi:hypothetical protein